MWASSIGLRTHDHVVVYDSSAFVMGAARLWWTFKAMGHADVSVLDGGLSAWKSGGNAVTSDETTGVFTATQYQCEVQSNRVVGIEQMAANLESEAAVVLDARSYSRFIAGEEDEPWRFRFPEVRRGRIPGSKNLPFNELYNEDGTMKPVTEIRSMMEGKGVQYDKRCVLTCGSGITAACLALALDVSGHGDSAVYDGAWCDYGTSDLPVEEGEP